jgi:hypothetical protein
MYYLISKKDVMPRSLFITDVKSKVDISGIAIGGFGRVFRGEHKGQLVALKVLSRGHKHVSILPFFLLAVLICSTRVPIEKTADGRL